VGYDNGGIDDFGNRMLDLQHSQAKDRRIDELEARVIKLEADCGAWEATAQAEYKKGWNLKEELEAINIYANETEANLRGALKLLKESQEQLHSLTLAAQKSITQVRKARSQRDIDFHRCDWRVVAEGIEDRLSAALKEKL
jgi:hypothetical protein